MRDEQNQNPLVVTGTPVLTTGALLTDTDQALTFNGTTNSFAATDSTSLSITSSLSVEGFVKFAALPGSTKNIVSKASSYAVQLNSAGKLLFRLDNGGSNVTVTSNTTLATNTWYHFVCVYNDGYAGVEQIGKTSTGSSKHQLDDDNGDNCLVGKYPLSETAVLRTLNTRIEYFDEIWDVQARAVVYADNGSGSPGELMTTSETVTLTNSIVDWRTLTLVSFPLTPVVVEAGDYHIGVITDTVAGIPKVALRMGCELTGGTHNKETMPIGTPEDPFGTPDATGDDELDVYVDYDAVGRTGLEGTAAIYINGQFDNSSAYTADIGDNANSLIIATDFAGSVDEVSVWNRVLSPLEIATHYLAR